MYTIYNGKLPFVKYFMPNCHKILLMNKMVNKFSVRLKELREEKGISQLKLANELKVTQSTIAKWETGDREPSISFLIAIATYFGESIDYLVGRID